ncbi:MAG: L-histidine N(alpha)-methyltransferase [Chthonomonadales bacterium]
MGLVNRDQGTFVTPNPQISSRFKCIDLANYHRQKIGDVILEGLNSTPKRLPCRFFYDDFGSQLFEQICDLPEYYLTRTEESILQNHAANMIEAAGNPATIIEFGSGSSRKTHLLLRAALNQQPAVHYLPIDISHEMLVQSAADLLTQYDRLSVIAISSEYTDALERLHEILLESGPALFVMLGSNIGNFTQEESVEFLKLIRKAMRPGDSFLLGTDMAKDPDLIYAAYNDCAGVTAEFNLNILRRVNEELNGNFDLSRFRHEAPFVTATSRIEMRLISTIPQTVCFNTLKQFYDFEQGEYILTEYSHKYTPEMLEAICFGADLDIQESWFDPNWWFGVHLLQGSTT